MEDNPCFVGNSKHLSKQNLRVSHFQHPKFIAIHFDVLTFSQIFSLCCCLNLQTKRNLTTAQEFNSGAKVILDLTPYSDLGFGKTINEMIS